MLVTAIRIYLISHLVNIERRGHSLHVVQQEVFVDAAWADERGVQIALVVGRHHHNTARGVDNAVQDVEETLNVSSRPRCIGWWSVGI